LKIPVREEEEKGASRRKVRKKEEKAGFIDAACRIDRLDGLGEKTYYYR
jgi:hypothetical protein